MQWQELRSHLRHLSEADLKRVQEAFLLGQRAHAGQLRKSGESFFTHPIAIAHLLADMGGDADTIIAALLHDTVEDTDVTLPQIRMEFGDTVGNLIDGLTKLCKDDLAQRPTLDEQIETLRKIFTLMQQDVRIMIIKLVDRLHNMQTVGFLKPERQQALAQETLDVYVKIADRLSMQDMRDELESLCLTVLAPTEHTRLESLRDANERRGKTVIADMKRRLAGLQQALLDQVALHHEQKSWRELRKQEERGEAPATGLPDVIVVFTCPDADACYRMLGILHTRWQRETLSFQDFINSPLQNGYEALHTTVILDDGTRVRCKIRTEAMHVYARKGVASRCFDEQEKGLLEYLPWAKQISAVSEDTADKSEEFWKSLQNDILSEAIMVHGTDDRSMLIPKDATALDAALHLYEATALRTSAVYLNGKPASFSTPVSHADTVKIELAATPQVNLEWLAHTHTRTAMAEIRRGLSSLGRGEKIATGKALLDNYLSEHHRGFLEEFEQRTFDRHLKEKGFGSLEQTAIALAEGRTTAQEIDEALFKQAPKRTGVSRYSLACRFPVRLQGEIMEDLEPYSPLKVQFEHEQNGIIACRASFRLTEEQRISLQRRLGEIIEGGVILRPSTTPLVSALVSLLLFALWGLDPVVAHMLLIRTALTAVDVHVIRFLTLAVMSGTFLIYLRMRQKIPPSRLPLKNPQLWLSGALLCGVSLFTYLSLSETLPSHYTIAMTAAGIIAAGVSRYTSVATRVMTWALYGVGVLLLLLQTPQWPPHAAAYTMLAIVFFAAFTILSERYKQHEHVSARTAQYLFLLTLASLIFSVPVLPYVSFGSVSWSLIGATVLFSAFLSGLPYVIYYTSQSTYAVAARYAFFIIPFTLLGQAVFIYPLDAVTFSAACLVTLGAGIPIFVRDNGR